MNAILRLGMLASILLLSPQVLAQCGEWYPNCHPEDGWDTGCFSLGYARCMTKGDSCVGWVSGIGSPCIQLGAETCFDSNHYFCGPDVNPARDPDLFVQDDRDQDHDVDMHDVAWLMAYYDRGIHWVVWQDEHWIEVEESK
jgi:hypothetical protein